jgi:hypothetical protein
MPTLARVANPFALMLDPQAVLAKIAHSERLERLQRRVCRPLDRPLLSTGAGGSADMDGDADADALGADDTIDGDAADDHRP